MIKNWKQDFTFNIINNHTYNQTWSAFYHLGLQGIIW